MAQFNPIFSERLIIRRLEEEDADGVLEYRRLREVYIYQGFKPESRDDALQFIRMRSEEPNISGSRFQLAVCLRESGRLIGDIGLRFLSDGKQMEIGYTIHPEFQGQGYASEALSSVFDYLFFELRKHRITASIDPENYKSIDLCKRLRMRKEAHFVRSLEINGEWVDDVIYAILAEEWMEYNREGRHKFERAD